MAGNATITLSNGNKDTTYEVWLQNFSTASVNEFSSQQTAQGIQWVPIRRAEMSVQFSIVWPLVASYRTKDLGFEQFDPRDGFGKMQYFQDAIRKHQMAIVNGSTNKPMVFNYYNNSDPKSPIFNPLISKNPLNALKYSGWIKNVEKNYIRFQTVYVTNYVMNILTKNIAKTPNTLITKNITYAPTASTLNLYDNTNNVQWYNSQTLASNVGYIQGLPK